MMCRNDFLYRLGYFGRGMAQVEWRQYAEAANKCRLFGQFVEVSVRIGRLAKGWQGVVRELD